MKSLLTQFLIVAAASIAVAGALRSVKSPNWEQANAAALQERPIVLSRTQSMIRPVSSSSSESSQEPENRSGDLADENRMREGSQIKDPNAVFQIVGERIKCNLNKNGLSVIALENLTLERVHHYLLRGSDTPTWEIEGTITEYEGHNYLILKRAIVNSLDIDE